MNFADQLVTSMEKRGSVLCAGLDLRPESIPECYHCTKGADQERIEKTVTDYYLESLKTIEPHVACIKPNIAFFEQFGLGALVALVNICKHAKSLQLPVILDAKRGDIGSTNDAYAKAYLGCPSFFGATPTSPPVDAITVNAFLGLESATPFVRAATTGGKGIFVLARTSNPDASYIQDARDTDNQSVSELVANWIHTEGESLLGNAGLSSLGAVVGATTPEQATGLRSLMPKNLFLVPGYGTQGGSAAEAFAGAIQGVPPHLKGVVINSSRGLFGISPKDADSHQAFRNELLARTTQAKEDLMAAATA